MIDVRKIKQDFPIYNYHPEIVYLDSTATSLNPKVVVDKLKEYYYQYPANIFRGLYKISERATNEYEETREEVARFINAKTKEIIFTRNTTESLNLVAYSLGKKILQKNDEIVTSIMEHHSNFVPWQVLSLENNLNFKIINLDREGNLFLKRETAKNKNSKLKPIQKANFKLLEKIITKKTKILALTYVSNVLGTINPIKKIISKVKEINPEVVVVIDAAQAVPHIKIDVQDLGCDFLAFSSHKMLGPTGVGVLWGRYDLLETMFPFQYGGEMVREVKIDKTVYNKPPYKFEAGTPHIAGVVALKEAIKYIENIGYCNIRDHEEKLLKYAFSRLKEEFQDKINILGPRDIKKRCALIAFSFNQIHPHDIGQMLDESNICLRAGHHCAMELHHYLGLTATARASFYIYNDQSDVDRLVEGLKRVKKVLR